MTRVIEVNKNYMFCLSLHLPYSPRILGSWINLDEKWSL